MSYELDHIRKCKCACGQGYVVQEIYLNDWGVAVVPGSKYTAATAAKASWASAIMADDIFDGTYTHSGAVWDTARTLTATFTTDATGKVVLGFRLKGNIGGWPGTYGIKMNNFAITEVAQ